MFFALTPPGGSEWIIILVVVVLLFGATKLPQLGSAVGKSIQNFKKGLEEAHDESAEGAEDGGPDGDRSAQAGGDGAGADKDDGRPRTEGSS